MLDILKNPKKQIGIIVILLIGYWTLDITILDEHIPIKQETVQDSLVVESHPESLESREQQTEMSRPPDSSKKSDSSSIDTDYELKIQFWDMIFGHLASILGSLAALLSPLITVYLNKKGYFNPSENQEN